MITAILGFMGARPKAALGAAIGIALLVAALAAGVQQLRIAYWRGAAHRAELRADTFKGERDAAQADLERAVASNTSLKASLDAQNQAVARLQADAQAQAGAAAERARRVLAHRRQVERTNRGPQAATADVRASTDGL
ncbi:MAG: hypothetical protein AB7Q97_01785 [Gammaproteobacteria bacterium]